MLRGRSFDDKAILATALWAAVGYALYETWPLESPPAVLAWVAVPLLFQWLIALVLWRRGLPWATLEALGRVLYLLLFIALWLFTPVLSWVRGWHMTFGPLALAAFSLLFLALAEFGVGRVPGAKARQERVEQRDRWQVLHQVPFLDVLFVRLPRL